ncbi:MAG TPA: M48 family metalloprotease [Bryobacteraceae bacterium]
MKHATRSVFTLTFLFGLVFLIADLYLSSKGAPIWIAGALGVGFILLNFLAAPWWIEYLLDIHWDSNRPELPARNLEFLKQLSTERGLTTPPRVAVIQCAMPNAFTFGHVQTDARIVVTSALLEILTPDEVNAVIAHEVGHIVHWDFIVMTLSSLVPLLLWELCAFLGDNRGYVRLAAYVSYWVSRFGVLSLSRTREYYADQFAAQATRAPGLLSTALLKLGYGMAQYASLRQAQSQPVKASKSARSAGARQTRLDGIFGMLGISNAQPSLSLSGVTPDEAARVIRWDLVNPFARLYEKAATHPLIGRRIEALNKEALAQGQAPTIPIPADLPMDWSNFLTSLILWIAPWICGIVLIARPILFRHSEAHGVIGIILTVLLFASWTARIAYRYPPNFTPHQVRALTENTSVSDMSAIPVRLEGSIVGSTDSTKLTPDLMFQDSTGMIFVLDRQSIPGARILLAQNANTLAGAKVVLDGWYRRKLRPYVELKKLETDDGRIHTSYSCYIQIGWALLACGVLYWLTRWS